MQTIYARENTDASCYEHWELRLDEDSGLLFFYAEGGAKLTLATMPWRAMGRLKRDAVAHVPVTGEFAKLLLAHLQAGGFIEEDLDWYWLSNGTVALRFDTPPPTVQC